MERWRPETNTFHMYHGECTITLQDVAHLTGLPVTGEALYVEYKKETNWAAIDMLSIIGGFILPDRSSAYVHCQYLLALREQRTFAWGAAVLSWMCRELGRVTFKIEGGPTNTSARDIGGWMVLLQTWCLEHFPNIARRRHESGPRRPQSRVSRLNERRIFLIF
ncbi:Serine/threonine-protein phosphatase 7 long form homolog [Linum grandiflorum]